MLTVYPSFLTNRLAHTIVKDCLNMLKKNYNGYEFNIERGSLVVLAPAYNTHEVLENAVGSFLMQNVSPHILYELHIGDKSTWKHDYSRIARGKAEQLWFDRPIALYPHLAVGTETHYTGAVKRGGIVVAFSGCAEYVDMFISSVVADSLIFAATHVYLQHRKELAASEAAASAAAQKSAAAQPISKKKTAKKLASRKK